MNNTKTFQTLHATDIRTYMAASLLITGNMLLPQLCHLVPMGGKILLPIFFFTLVGAYRYGIVVGMTTAVLSPIANSALFGLPAETMLPPMLLQSILLAAAAAAVAYKSQNVSALLLAGVAVPCQLAGLIFENIMATATEPLSTAMLTAIPGLLLQVYGGMYLIKKL